MFPPLSLLAGMYLTDCEESGHISKTLIFSHLFFSLLTAGAIALAPIHPDGGPIIRWLIVFFMVLAAVLAALGLKKGRFRAFMMTQALLILVFVLSIWGAFASAVSSLFTSAAIAEKLASTDRDPSIPLYVDTFYRPSAAFYTDIYGKALPEFDRRKQETDEKNEEKGVLLPGKETSRLPENAYILVQKKVFKNWPEEQKSGLTVLWEKDTALLLLKKED